MGNWDSYRDDLDALKIELEKLFEVRNDVMIRRVRIAEEEEQEMMKPTDEVVQLWLSKVQAVETEVDDLIRQISQEIEELHPGGFCFRNLLNMPSSYEFEDKVADKLQAVMNLITEGASVVADDEARVVTIPKDGGAPVIEEFVAENLPEDVPYVEGTIVGMDSIFTEVRRCLEEGGEEGGGYVGIIGLYGMGGVGKTTLLKQIYQKQNNFAVVIWVSFSKELRLEKIQEKIGMKIGLSDKVWKNKNFEEKASDILEILRKKKFVLLMDELWKRVDLTKVGVPFPNPENSSKIVFTTRSLEICRLMEADRQFKINCLADEEAWKLFKASVGDETLHSHPEQVVDIARDISKECSGLPLALASIGRALAGDKTRKEWSDVLGVLTRRSRSTSSISGSDDQLKKVIYYNLKLSYDHLQNDMFKSCLLYCCLFPRNDKISKGHLIDCWIGEGFLDDRLGAKSQGYHIIDVFLSACLLEEEEEDDNYVKMHNWIHDMTLWITTEIEEEKRNFFVCVDADLTELPEIEKWVNMTRISMTKNGFTNLKNAPTCSHLQTLFLNKNKIEKIGDDFFRFMPCLKVLNLSDNLLQELPSEISNLVSLQHLDLSHTTIKRLPNELGDLKKLKCLNLESTLELCAIPPWLISTLTVLHVLRLQECGFLDRSGEDGVACNDAQLLIEELLCLKNLSMLSISLRNSHALQKLLSSYRLQSCIQSLWLQSLQHPKSIVISISYMNHLKTLRISKCKYLEELEVDFVGEAQAQQAISNFYFLDEVIIEICPNLRDLTWLILAPNLKRLEISQCSELEEIIKVGKLSECPELMRNLTPFLKLQFLKLSNLPNLRSIYRCDLLFPDLKEGTKTKCPNLQISLPLHRFNKDHSKEIITVNVPSGPSGFNRKQVDPTGSDDVCSSTISGFSTGSVPFPFSKETKDWEDNMETDEVHQVVETQPLSNFELQSKSVFSDLAISSMEWNSRLSKSVFSDLAISSMEWNSRFSMEWNSRFSGEAVTTKINALGGPRCESIGAVKIQKFYRSYRTRRRLADSAVVAEELWWQAIDYARLDHSTISFFDFSKSETAASKWNRAILNASKMGKGLSNDSKAQKLAFQHWIEAIDPQHRYGHNLHKYYKEWCKTDSGQPFFCWLDVRDGKKIELRECSRSKLKKQRIIYMGPQERENYEYTVVDGKIIHKQTGDLFDTNKGSQGAKWIFVMSTLKNLYAGEKKKGIFQHSSFLAGGATIAAGRLEAEQGILKSISAYSGHYRSIDDRLGSFLSFLMENGVNLDKVKIHMPTEDYSDSYNDSTSILDENAVEVPTNSELPEPDVPKEEEEILSKESLEVKPTRTKSNYERTLFGGLQIPRAEVPRKAILHRMNSKKAVQSYQLGNQLSLKWTTGVGPRIGCVADYPAELRMQALEFVDLPPRTTPTPWVDFGSPTSTTNPTSYSTPRAPTTNPTSYSTPRAPAALVLPMPALRWVN